MPDFPRRLLSRQSAIVGFAVSFRAARSGNSWSFFPGATITRRSRARSLRWRPVPRVLASEALVTLARAAPASAWPSRADIPLGVFVARTRVLFRLFEPAVNLLRPLPPLAIVPIVMLFAGPGSAAKVWTIFYSASIPILLNTMDGVAISTDDDAGRAFPSPRPLRATGACRPPGGLAAYRRRRAPGARRFAAHRHFDGNAAQRGWTGLLHRPGAGIVPDRRRHGRAPLSSRSCRWRSTARGELDRSTPARLELPAS